MGISFRFALGYLVFLHFDFHLSRFIFSLGASFWVLSRSGGPSVVSFTLVFVSVEHSASIRQPTCISFHFVWSSFVVSLAVLKLWLGVGGLFAVRCCVYGFICS